MTIEQAPVLEEELKSPADPESQLSAGRLKEDVPMDEQEASVERENEAVNMEDLKKVEPVMIRTQKSIAQKSATKRKIPGLAPEEVEEGEEHLMSLKRLKCRPPSYLEIPMVEGEQ